MSTRSFSAILHDRLVTDSAPSPLQQGLTGFDIAVYTLKIFTISGTNPSFRITLEEQDTGGGVVYFNQSAGISSPEVYTFVIPLYTPLLNIGYTFTGASLSIDFTDRLAAFS